MEQTWYDGYVQAVHAAFGARIVCIGVQGSQARGEAGPDSDIDMVLILDRMDAADLERYREAVAGLSGREKLCGFVSGRETLRCWDRAELVSFYYDTRPIEGDLDFLLPEIGPAAARRSVHAGACAIYHACAHNLVHAQDAQVVDELRKAAFFVMRTQYFCRHGVFITGRAALMERLDERSRAVLEADDWQASSARLLAWAEKLIIEGEGL